MQPPHSVRPEIVTGEDPHKGEDPSHHFVIEQYSPDNRAKDENKRRQYERQDIQRPALEQTVVKFQGDTN